MSEVNVFNSLSKPVYVACGRLRVNCHIVFFSLELDGHLGICSEIEMYMCAISFVQDCETNVAFL